ncbi:MAG: hypothetical protein N4A50_13420 [Vallitalea sp.]|jgi:hypothetical protein|nr:hypothetical protein [Vallitalea sp.]
MKKKLGIILIAVIILISGIIYFVPQARLIFYVLYHNNIKSSTEFTVDGDKLYMDGYICSKTPEQLKKVIKENNEIKTIVMKDVLGSLDDEANFPMSKYVRESGLNTYLTKNSEVASGGTDFFLAGNKRTIEDGAKIGVHSWRDLAGTEAKDLPKTHEEHKIYTEYMNYMLGNDDFYWYTIYAASAEDMHYMTNEEIIEYNVITEPIVQN